MSPEVPLELPVGPVSFRVWVSSDDACKGANREVSVALVFAKSPDVDRGKGTRGRPGTGDVVSIWSLSPLCLYELDTRASSTPFNFGTYDARGEGRELLFRGAKGTLLAPVGGEGVLDSRLDDGLDCFSLVREECRGTGSSMDD